MLHIDLDRFKLLNDSLGPELADQVLQKIAERLTKALPEADTISRLSSDEFAVLFDAYGSLTSLARVATRLMGKLSRPIVVDGHELVVSASMGDQLVARWRPRHRPVGQPGQQSHATGQTHGWRDVSVFQSQPATQHP